MKMTSTNIPVVFESLRETFVKQDAVRDALRERREAADVAVRAAQQELVTFHTASDLPAAAIKVRQLLQGTGTGLAAIESVLPKAEGSFYRFADIWGTLRQAVSTVAVVVDFVDGNKLPDIDRVKKLCGGVEFRLPLEDFLYGVCNAVSEFVRLSMNRVIQGDYDTPARCAVFATQVFEAFRELNFRNDFLRKRYDGVKYDIKRLEEIVYDLSIRGLLNTKEVGMIKEEPTEGGGVMSDGKSDGNSVAAPKGNSDITTETSAQQATMDTAE